MNAFCDGCGSKLGWKKYKFRGLWKIPGVYCRECMIKLGSNFEESSGGLITLPKLRCTLCNNSYYFLKNVKTEKGKEQYCNFCYAIVNSGERSLSNNTVSSANITHISSNTDASKKPLARPSLVTGMTGIMLMISGFIFALFSIGSEGGNLISFIFGTGTSMAGFILFRRFILTNGLPKQIMK